MSFIDMVYVLLSREQFPSIVLGGFRKILASI